MGNGRSIFFDGVYSDGIIGGGPSKPPSVPTALPATNITTTSFRANWTTVPGAFSYRIDISLSSTFSSFVQGYQDFFVVGSYLDVYNFDLSQTYYYRVRASNSNGISGNSNTIAVTALAIYIVTAGDINANNATIVWATNKPATSRVDYGVNAADLSLSVESPELTEYHSMLLSSLSMEQLYYFRVTSTAGAETAVSGLYSFSTSAEFNVPISTKLLGDGSGILRSLSKYVADFEAITSSDNYSTIDPDADVAISDEVFTNVFLIPSTLSVSTNPSSEYDTAVT